MTLLHKVGVVIGLIYKSLHFWENTRFFKIHLCNNIHYLLEYSNHFILFVNLYTLVVIAIFEDKVKVLEYNRLTSECNEIPIQEI